MIKVAGFFVALMLHGVCTSVVSAQQRPYQPGDFVSPDITRPVVDPMRMAAEAMRMYADSGEKIVSIKLVTYREYLRISQNPNVSPLVAPSRRFYLITSRLTEPDVERYYTYLPGGYSYTIVDAVTGTTFETRTIGPHVRTVSGPL